MGYLTYFLASVIIKQGEYICVWTSRPSSEIVRVQFLSQRKKYLFFEELINYMVHISKIQIGPVKRPPPTLSPILPVLSPGKHNHEILSIFQTPCNT